MSLRNRDYSGNLNRKQQIDIFGEVALEGTIARSVVTNNRILILYDTTEGTGGVGRIECHNVHTFVP